MSCGVCTKLNKISPTNSRDDTVLLIFAVGGNSDFNFNAVLLITILLLSSYSNTTIIIITYLVFIGCAGDNT